MKRVLAWVILLALVISLVSCGKASGEALDSYSTYSYKNIPGVTQEEIDAVEAIKAKYDSFSYGHLVTTEAFKQTDDSYAGFTIEVCELLSEMFDIQFSPKAYDEWSELKSDIDNVVLDFSGDFTHTTERMQIYKMTTPIAGRILKVYNLTSSPEITTETDINGMKVGFFGGAVAAELIVKLYPGSSFESVDISSFSGAAEMLLSGEIDAFVMDGVSDTMFEKSDYIRGKDIFKFAYAPVSVTTKNSELEPIISVIDKYLSSDGMDTMFRLYREGELKYKKHRLNLSFTDAELKYLEDLKTRGAEVNVALQHDAYPASFYNSVEKRYDGAAYDILTEVSELTGIEFNSDCMPVEKPLSEILAKLKSGEISMMPQLLYSDSRKDDYIWSRVSYITTNYAMLSKWEYPALQPFQVYYANVGTINKSAHEELFKAFFPDHEKNFVYQTGDEGFDALERGEIDLLMLAETMLLVQTNYREKLGYKVNITFDKTLDTLFGFNKDEVILRDIFDKSLAYIDIKGIEESWLSRTFDYQSKMLKDSIPFIILFVALLLAALLIVLMFYIKNRRLNKSLEGTVRERTRELERKTATLSTIYSSIPDLLFCKDLNGIYTGCNLSFEKFAGVSESELIGKSDIEVFKIDEEMAKLFIEEDKKVFTNVNTEVIEELITYPDGKQKLVETYRAPLVQKDEVVGIVGISRDITERKAAESKLLRMSSIVNSSPQYIAYVNSDGNFDFLNPAAHETTGYSYDELMSGGLKMLYDEETNERIRNEILPKIFEFGKYDFELPLTRKDGKKRILAFSAFTITSDEYGCGTIASDVTEQKQLERNLIEAKELAEQNSRAKSEFLSRMSHEMRTPMNAIIGMTSIAKDSNDIERKDYCLDKIDSASTHLLGVINDVLDMSKIEAGKFEISPTDFRLEKMLIKITNVVNFRMEEKGQSFAIKVDPDVPQAIISDEQRLSQIITNLLGNAVKFTPDNGAISLFVRKLSEENGLYTLEFEVKDTGIGIPEEQQKRLFTSFEQADGSVSRKYGGTGLGLAISKYIVEMMDGRIWIESKVGEGSSFIFTIRAKKGSSKTNLLHSDINLKDLRILAVDDDEDMREYFLSLTNSLKLQCETASGGIEVRELMKGNASFDIFFVDWKMPYMDGIELTKLIKKKYPDSSVIIMTSAMEWSHIEDEAKRAGVDKFIPKPLFASVIAECINECLSATQNQAADGGVWRDGRESFKGRHILLAEDVAINREIVIALLASTGIRIDCAEDGGKAYQMFKDNPCYDMIFMDIQMPDIDGYNSTQMIRALDDPHAKQVPIIAMTANVFKEDIEKCMSVGMNGHIGKPIDRNDLMAMLGKWMPDNQIEAAPKAFYNIQTEPRSELLRKAAQIGMDIDTALERLGGMQNVLENSIRQTERSISERLEAMEGFLTSSDIERFSIDAHGFKSSLASIGAMELSGLASELETAANMGDHQKCAEKFTLFAPLMDEFAEELKRILPVSDDSAAGGESGDADILPRKLEKIISYLENFESDEALALTEELCRFTYGKETDALLAKAKSAIETYDYDGAIEILRQIELKGSDT